MKLTLTVEYDCHGYDRAMTERVTPALIHVQRLIAECLMSNESGGVLLEGDESTGLCATWDGTDASFAPCPPPVAGLRS